VILNRPFRDRAINEVTWRVADEQVVTPAVRRANEANGLRIGRVTGELPRELETILKEGGPENPKVVPTNLFIESGEQSLISIRDGQQEESLPELAADLVLETGQVVVVGCRPESQRSLGSFLFSEATAESGPSHQRLIMIWASRNLPGVIDEKSKNHDRPKLFKRQLG